MMRSGTGVSGVRCSYVPPLIVTRDKVIPRNAPSLISVVGSVVCLPGWPGGFVAIFAQEVEKGQWPLSVEGLRGQGVEQFGRSEAFVSSLHYHLSFLDHVHEFDPDQGILGCVKRFKPQHGPCHPLDPSMALLHHIV